MAATVINVSIRYLRELGYENFHDWEKDPNHVYIGRKNTRMGIEGSKWANPFKSNQEISRDETLALYRKYVEEGDLYNQLDELEGKELGCWCTGATCDIKCHGHVLVTLLTEKMINEGRESDIPANDGPVYIPGQFDTDDNVARKGSKVSTDTADVIESVKPRLTDGQIALVTEEELSEPAIFDDPPEGIESSVENIKDVVISIFPDMKEDKILMITMVVHNHIWYNAFYDPPIMAYVQKILNKL